MRYLVIVHLEPDFEASAGPLEPLARKVKSVANLYDRVLNITSASGLSGTQSFPELMDFPSKEWIWGFDANYYLTEQEEEGGNYWQEGKTYLKTNGHEYSEIHDWIHNLPKFAKYTLVGGGRTECLQDIYNIFQHLGLNVKINERLTY